MNYKNYTNINIVLYDEQGNQIKTIISENMENFLFNKIIDNKEILDDNMTIITVHYEDTNNVLPEVSNLMYIVTPYIKSLFPNRTDIVTLDFKQGAIRDDKGIIIGFKYFIR